MVSPKPQLTLNASSGLAPAKPPRVSDALVKKLLAIPLNRDPSTADVWFKHTGLWLPNVETLRA